jgi:hypothetical protein
MLAALSDWLVVAPLAFLVGMGVGLALASRYRITRVDQPNNQGEER